MSFTDKDCISLVEYIIETVYDEYDLKINNTAKTLFGKWKKKNNSDPKKSRKSNTYVTKPIILPSDKKSSMKQIIPTEQYDELEESLKSELCDRLLTSNGEITGYCCAFPVVSDNRCKFCKGKPSASIPLPVPSIKSSEKGKIVAETLDDGLNDKSTIEEAVKKSKKTSTKKEDTPSSSETVQKLKAHIKKNKKLVANFVSTDIPDVYMSIGYGINKVFFKKKSDKYYPVGISTNPDIRCVSVNKTVKIGDYWEDNMKEISETSTSYAQLHNFSNISFGDNDKYSESSTRSFTLNDI